MKFSFIIPVHNGMPYIKECLDSIFKQTYTNFNIIVLENQSNDGTLEYIQSIHSDKITILPSDTLLNIEQNWSRIKDVKANEFMIIACADDRYYPNYLAEMVKCIRQHPNASIYRTYVDMIDETSKVIMPAKPLKERYSWYDYLKERLTHEYFETAMGYCFRTKDYKEIGGIDCVWGLLHPDDKLFMQLAKKSYLAITPICACSYRSHSKSLSTNPDMTLSIGGYKWFFNWLKSTNDPRIYQIVQKYLPLHLYMIRGFYNEQEMQEQEKMCQVFGTRPNNSYVRQWKRKEKLSRRVNKIKRTLHLIPKDITSPVLPQRDIHVVLASDDNYVPYMATTMASCLKTSAPNDRLCFYLLCNHISDDKKQKLLELKKLKPCYIEFLDLDDKEFKDFPAGGVHISNTTYYRYKIADLLPEVDKIIYMDCDVIVTQSLWDLYNTDLADFPLAGVEDVGYTYWRTKLPEFIHQGFYINAGVLLINTRLWREENVSDKLMQYTRQHASEIKIGDQDVINALFKDRIKKLEYRWNVQDSFLRAEPERAFNIHRKEIEQAAANPGIIHYTQVNKAWNSFRKPLAEEWFYYNCYVPAAFRKPVWQRKPFRRRFFRRVGWQHTNASIMGGKYVS